MLTDMLTDMRYGIRQMLKAPGFTIVAILTLAFGVGATSAIFSVVNGVLLRPLPYPEPGDAGPRVRGRAAVPADSRVAPANFLDWRQQNDVFEHLAAYTGSSETFNGSEGPERINMALVSWDLFELVKSRRHWAAGSGRKRMCPGQTNAIVLSHGMWQRRFGADPNVLGRSISLSGAPVTIVGVMPEGFFFPYRETEFWRPIGIDPANARRGSHFLEVIARLKAGTSAGTGRLRDEAHRRAAREAVSRLQPRRVRRDDRYA